MQFFISEELRSRLLRIDSPLVRAILDLKEVDEQNTEYINYLGISHDDCTMISYMNKAKIERYKDDKKEIQVVDYSKPHEIIMTEGCVLGYFRSGFLKPEGSYKSAINGWDGKYYINLTKDTYSVVKEELLNGNQAFYLNLGSPSFVCTSYFSTATIKYFKDLLPQYKTIIEEQLWNSKIRFHGKAAKTLRKILGNTFSSDLYEEFASIYRKEAMKECGLGNSCIFEEVKGDKIKWAYLEDNYCEGSSDLLSSCMRYTACQEYFELYINNPDKCSLALFTRDGLVAARALIWRDVYSVDTNEKQSTMFDRIYAATHEDYLVAKGHLESLDYKDLYVAQSSEAFKIDLSVWNCDAFPYLDSFRWSEENIFTTEKDWGNRTYNDTEGQYEQYHHISCDNCGDYFDDEDSLREIDYGPGRGDHYCYDCREHSDHLEGYIATSYAVYASHIESHILESDSIYSNKMGEYYLRDSTITTEEGHVYLISDEDDRFVEIDGNHFTLDVDEMTQIDGEWMWNKDIVSEEV